MILYRDKQDLLEEPRALDFNSARQLLGQSAGSESHFNGTMLELYGKKLFLEI